METPNGEDIGALKEYFISQFFELEAKGAFSSPAIQSMFQPQFFDPTKTITPLFQGTEGPRDAELLVKLYLTGGPKISNIHRNAQSRQKRVLNYLTEKYKLRDNTGGKYDTITLSRIAAAFPIIVVTILNDTFTPKINFLDTGILLPTAFSDKAFLSTIPVNKMDLTDVSRLVAIVSAHQIERAKVINRNMFATKSNLEIFEANKVYFKNAMTSQVRNEDENENLAKKLTNIYEFKEGKFLLTADVMKIGDAALGFTLGMDLSFIYSHLTSNA